MISVLKLLQNLEQFYFALHEFHTNFLEIMKNRCQVLKSFTTINAVPQKGFFSNKLNFKKL
jgi:hypothetical protein